MQSITVLDGNFKVFEDGGIYRVRGQKSVPATISFTCRGQKYGTVSYMKDGKQKRLYVHRIVAEAFLPNPNDFPQVNHIDGNTKNNCVSNLEWCTARHNIRHAYANGLINHYRSSRVCACCGKSISDNNPSGLCGKCQTTTAETQKYRSNKVFIGVVEFNKCVNDMTNRDIAMQTGYAKDTIDKFLCGKRMSKNVADRICKLFSIEKGCFAYY